MNTNEAAIRQELATVEDYLHRLTEAQRLAQGERDRLLRQLLDNDGAHDRRPVAVR